MMKKILILGSAGQVGHHLLLYLRNKNYTVYEFDIVNSKKEDLRVKNNNLLKRLVKNSDFIFGTLFGLVVSKINDNLHDQVNLTRNWTCH